MDILLAEDDLLSRELATRVLTRAGHQVTATETGPQVVEAFGAGAFDLVVMDLQLPGMDGLAATAAIRALEAENGGYTPIVALTAQADAGDRRRCLAAGMDGYLTKPFAIGDLIAAVDATQVAKARVDECSSCTADTSAILDWDAAHETVAGNTELLRTMGAMFIDLSITMTEDVRRAVAARDAAALQRAAHKLKGSVTHFAAGRAIAAARALEDAGSDAEFGAVDERLAELEAALESLRAALAAGPPSD